MCPSIKLISTSATVEQQVHHRRLPVSVDQVDINLCDRVDGVLVLTAAAVSVDQVDINLCDWFPDTMCCVPR